jgi:hypothetical protein
MSPEPITQPAQIDGDGSRTLTPGPVGPKPSPTVSAGSGDSPHPAAAAALHVICIRPEARNPQAVKLATEVTAVVHREIAAHAEEIRHYNGFTTAEDVADWLLARADEIEGTSR